MIDLEFLKSSGYFQTLILKRDEVLFREWDTDNNLYIVYDWELCVQKWVSSQWDDFKVLWLLGVGNILWESSLTRDEKKEVQVQAHRESILLCIDAKTDFSKFMSESPDAWYELLLAIIDLGNKRLLRANREVTANYEVSKAISNIYDITQKSIFELLQKFQQILEWEQILYFEKNIVMHEYYKLKYNSQPRDKDNDQENIFKIQNNILNIRELEKMWIEVKKYSRSTPLFLWDVNHWFLVIARDSKDFHENEEKLLQNTATNFVGLIRQKEILDNERNKNYVKSI